MAAPRIHQSTFNEAVAENVEEFEMTLQEAVADAKEQLAAEGYDLSDLVTDGVIAAASGIEGAAAIAAAVRSFRHPVEAAKADLEALGAEERLFETDEDVAAASRALGSVITLFDESGTDEDERTSRMTALRSRCAASGLVPAVCAVLAKLHALASPPAAAASDDVVVSDAAVPEKAMIVGMASEELSGALSEGMHALRRLCFKSDECRAGVSTAAIDAMAGGLARHAASPALACAAGRCAGMVATRVEGFKRRLVEKEAPTSAVELLSGRMGDDNAVRAACAVLRAVTARDDPSAKMAQGFECAKAMAHDGTTVPLLIRTLSVAVTPDADGASPAWGRVAELFLALRALHVNNDSCNAMLDSGAIGSVIVPIISSAVEAAKPPPAGEEESPAAPAALRVVRAGFALLKALSNSDAVKRAMADPVLAAGGAGASAGADWGGGGSASGMGIMSAAPAMAEAAAEAVAAASASASAASDGVDDGPVVGMLLMLRTAHLFRDRADTADQALAALASCVLRVEENARLLVSSGGQGVILTVMRRHPDHGVIQRHGALALRNAVSWDKTLIGAIVMSGAEDVLRAALRDHPEHAGEAARAALRDLMLD